MEYGINIDISKLKNALKDALKDFKPIVQTAVMKVVDLVGGRIDLIKSKAGQIATILGFGDQWAKVEAKIDEVLQKIKDKIIDVSSDEEFTYSPEYGLIDISKLKAALKDALKDFKPIIQTAVMQVVDLVGGRIDLIQSKAGQIATILGFGDQWAKIDAKINEVLQKIKDKIIDVSSDEEFTYSPEYGFIDINKLKAALKDALKDFKPIVQTAVMKVVDLVGGRIDLIKSKAGQIATILGFGDQWAKVEAKIDEVLQKIKDKIIDVSSDEEFTYSPEYGLIDISKLKAALKDALKDFKPIIQTAVMQVVDLVGGRIDLIQSKAGQIATILGFGDQWAKIDAKINEVLQKIKDKIIDVSSDEEFTYSPEYGFIDINKLKAALKDALKDFKPIVQTAVMKVVDLVGGRIDLIKSKAGQIATILGFGDQWAKVEAKIDEVLQKIKDKIIDVSSDEEFTYSPEYGLIDISKLKAALKDALKDFKPIIQTAVMQVVDLVGGRIDLIQSKAGQIATILGFGDQWAKIDAKINEVLQKIKDKIIDVSSDEEFTYSPEYGFIDINKLKAALKDALKDFKPIVQTAVMKVVDLVGGRIDLIKSKAGQIATILGFGDQWAKVEAKIDEVLQKIKDKIIDVSSDEEFTYSPEYGLIDISKLKAALKDALKDFKPIIQTAVMQVVDLVGGRIDLIQSKAGQIATILGFGDQWAKIDAKINEVLQKIKDKIIDVSSDEEFTYSPEYGFIDINKLKAALKDALKDFKPIVQTAVLKVVDLVGGRIELIKSKAGQIATILGFGDQWAKVEAKIDEVLQKIKDKIIDVSSDEESYAFKDIWAKVKAAAAKLHGNVKDRVEKAIAEHKPKIIDGLKTVKQIVIGSGKKIIIQIRDNVVKIITDAGTSDDQMGYGFKDIWAKVKAAAENLHGDLKDRVKKAIEEHKPKIIDGLNTVKEVVIGSGKKIIIQIRDSVVRIIAGAETTDAQLAQAAYGFRDVWAKVKEAAKKLGGQVKVIVMKVVAENKPLIMAELQKMKEVLIKAGKKVLIEITNNAVKIIVGDQVAYSHVQLSAYGFKDFWKKVTDAFTRFDTKTKEFFKNSWNTIKPKIVAALEKTKSDLNGFKEVIVETGKKIWVKVVAGKVKIVADVKQVWGKVEAAASKVSEASKAEVQAIIAKYKPLIIEGLNDVKQVVITEGKRVVITIRDNIVKIIVNADITESNAANTYGIKNWWSKVKDAAKQLKDSIKATIMKEIEAAKPHILEQLNTVKSVIINGTKKVLIQIVNGAVQIIIGDEIVQS
jgi:uncharacterized protein YjhX (UPF0386 family)